MYDEVGWDRGSLRFGKSPIVCDFLLWTQTRKSLGYWRKCFLSFFSWWLWLSPSQLWECYFRASTILLTHLPFLWNIPPWPQTLISNTGARTGVKAVVLTLGLMCLTMAWESGLLRALGAYSVYPRLESLQCFLVSDFTCRKGKGLLCGRQHKSQTALVFITSDEPTL